MAQIKLGDVSNSNLKEIFNSEPTRILRHQMLQGRLDALAPPCDVCDTVLRRRILGVPLDSLKYLKE